MSPRLLRHWRRWSWLASLALALAVGVLIGHAMAAWATVTPTGTLAGSLTGADLLSGAILTLVLLSLKTIDGVRSKLGEVKTQVAEVREHIQHVPTKVEVAEDLKETRHLMRNLVDGVQKNVQNLEQEVVGLTTRVTTIEVAHQVESRQRRGHGTGS